MGTITISRLYEHESANYLTEPIADWDGMNYEEVYAFIDEHKWGPLEDMDADDIMSFIHASVNGTKHLLISLGISIIGE